MEETRSLRVWLAALVALGLLLALQWPVFVLVFGGFAAVLMWDDRIPRYATWSSIAGLVGLPLVAGSVLWIVQVCSRTAPPDVLWALPVCIGTMSMRYWTAGLVPITVACFWWGGAVAGWLVEDHGVAPSTFKLGRSG